MEKDIYTVSNELKDLLDSDIRIIKLNELEKKMNDNEEVMALSYQKDLAVSNYSDALNHFSKDSKEVKDAHHLLYLAKEKLDNHPLVREYLEAYKEVRDLYLNLNDILFSNLALHLKKEK